MAKKSSIRKRGAVPLGKICPACRCSYNPALDACPRCRDMRAAHWQAVVDTWDAVEDGRDNHCLDLQVEGLRRIANKLSIPYVAALLLNGEVTTADLQAWAAWPEADRAALIAATTTTDGDTAEGKV